MLKFEKTNHTNSHFIDLVKQLDQELALKDGDEHSFYHQYNGIDMLNQVMVVYEDQLPIACGAIKPFSDSMMEVKRMFVLPSYRSAGIGSLLLNELEAWAVSSGASFTILETGKRQPDAVRLYTKNGYDMIPNYGQYASKDNSVCFSKQLQIISR